MDEVHVVRHKHFNEKQSIRRIAREMGIHRKAVRKYVGQAEPCRVEREARAQCALGSDQIRCCIASLYVK